MILKSIKAQIFSVVFFCSLTVEGQVTMIKNIDPGLWTSSGSYPKFLTRLGNKVLFSAVDEQHGGELWSTDGTAAGTVLISDINPERGLGSEIFAPVEMNGFVYFFATGEGDKKGLYRTDGTSEGTIFVKRFDYYDYNNSDTKILRVNNTLYFEASILGIGSELWKSDGTEAGTVLVKDIFPGSGGSSPKELTEVNGEIYFTANDGVNGIELWKSDGTAPGTFMVINYNGTGHGGINNLIAFQGNLFFSSYSVTGSDLWKTDGTTAGTQLVSSTANVLAYATYDGGRTICEYNGYLYFGGGPGGDSELWRSDGTAAGTVQFAAIYPSGSSEPSGFTEFNGELYFGAQNVGGRGLYKTNGSTIQALYSGHLDPKKYCVWNGIMYFQGTQNSSGRELWKTNGTVAGTVRIKDMSPANGDPTFITPLNATEVVFQGGNVSSNIELWKSDGTVAGTIMVKDICSQWNSATINEGVSMNNKVFFGPQCESVDSELWETNGTTSGTLQTKNMCALYCASFPHNFYKADSSKFYFGLTYNDNGQLGLAKSDGTAAGTIVIKATGLYEPNGFVPFNGYHLFLIGNNAIARTDGTTAGTITLKSGMYVDGPIVVSNGMAYFITNSQLWKTNGTVAGTTFVKTLGGSTGNLVELNGMLYFMVFIQNVGVQIWTSDGTTAGTVFFMDVDSNYSTLIREAIHFNNKLYFSMQTNTSGYELWVTDGTVAGTQIVKEIKAGQLGSDPKNFIIFNGKFYFSADDGIHGSELWESDGTQAGTIMVKDIYPGVQSSAPSKISIINNKLYFSANDGVSGHELWVSNGTACGTQLIQDVNPGNMGSFPLVLGSVNNQILLNLYQYDSGFELWEYTDNSMFYDTACISYTWSLNNQTYTSSGVYYDTIPSSSGCDSIITLNLTIFNPTNTTDIQSACDSYTWIDGNTYYSSTNTPTVVLQNVAGCDSTVTLNLTIAHSTTGTDVQSACDSLTWIDGNTYYASTNTPTFALQNAVGCDSLVTLDLTITYSTVVIDTQSACDSLTWIDGNTYYASTNVPTLVFQNSIGCDSIINLHLTILSDNTFDFQTACDSLTWIDGNTYYTSTNIPTVVLQNTAGCDSTVTLNLTIIHSTNVIDVQTACISYTWIDGNTYTSSTNTPTFVLQNAAGCDSIITLNLTLNNATTGTDFQIACNSYTWIDGNTYTSSTNIPTFSLPSATGCDSIITLNLTITNSNIGTDFQTACDSYTWIDGNTYTSSTDTPTFVLQNSAGCDSTVTLNLTIIPSLPLTVENVFVFPSDANTCVGEAAIDISGNAPFELDFDNGSQIVTSSSYSLVSGLCAGVHDLHVTDNCGDTLSTTIVIPVDSNYVFNNPFIDSLAQDSLGVTMTNCDIYYAGIDTAYIDSIWATGNTVNVIWNIVDSNGSNLDTTSYVLNNGNGVYWLQLSVFCPFKSVGEYFTVTEAVYFNNGSVSTAGLPDIGKDLFTIYPNPTTDQVHISFSGSEAELTVYDAQGKMVLKDHIQNQEIISLQNFERGVYLFDFSNSDGHSVQRVVKQ